MSPTDLISDRFSISCTVLPNISKSFRCPSELSTHTYGASIVVYTFLTVSESLSSLALREVSPPLASITSLDCCCDTVKALNLVSISFILFDTAVSKWSILGVSPCGPCGPSFSSIFSISWDILLSVSVLV